MISKNKSDISMGSNLVAFLAAFLVAFLAFLGAFF